MNTTNCKNQYIIRWFYLNDVAKTSLYVKAGKKGAKTRARKKAKRRASARKSAKKRR